MNALIWAGAIGGALVGVLGGLFGTCASIRNTRGPRERSFVIKASIVCWLLVVAFLVAMFAVPAPYSLLVIGVYVVMLLAAIRFWNLEQQRIRTLENEGS